MIFEENEMKKTEEGENRSTRRYFARESRRINEDTREYLNVNQK